MAQLTAGTFDPATGALTAGSMAEAMDLELAKLVPLGANEDPRGRRKLMAAIAQGVVNHLAANAGAFTVTVPNTIGTNPTHEQAAKISKA
jgi:hypothetical protein